MQSEREVGSWTPKCFLHSSWFPHYLDNSVRLELSPKPLVLIQASLPWLGPRFIKSPGPLQELLAAGWEVFIHIEG